MKVEIPDALLAALKLKKAELKIKAELQLRMAKNEDKKHIKLFFGAFEGLDGSSVWVEEVISETGEILQGWAKPNILMADEREVSEDDI